LAHLRDGGTTPWVAWQGDADSDGVLPGAQQLELLRRVNGVRRPSAALAARVLAGNAVGRGQADLPLVDGDPPAYGPAPVDPADLDEEELLRVAVGLLAEDLAAGPAPDPPAEPGLAQRALTRVRRRRYRLLGDPLVSGLLRDRWTAAGRPPAADPDLVVVLAGPLDRMLAGAWLDGCFSSPAVGWEAWLGKWRRLDRLPPRVDVDAVASEWTTNLGRRRVHVALDAAMAGRLVGCPGGEPDAPTPAAAELARRLHGPLGMLATVEERDRLLRHRLRPLLSTAPAPALVVPPRLQPWLRRHAARQAEAVARAGYAVHGSPAALAEESPGQPTGPGVALDLAVACLLDGRLRGER